MRLPYVEDPPHFTDPTDQAIVARIKERRGARGLIPLDRALLNSPPVADGWNSFLLAIRTQTTLSTSLREAAICRVAALNRAWYEWEHHAPLLLAVDGVNPQFVQAVFSAPPGSWPSNAHVPDKQHALVLEFTDALTLAVEVPQELFERLREVFDARSITEVTATIGCYNCVSRFLVALDVGERIGEEGMVKAIEHAGGVEPGTKPVPREYQ